MNDLIERIAECIEKGKTNKDARFPADMQEQDGALEITQHALADNKDPQELLNGCMLGMQRIGKAFAENRAFIPNLLMAAKAMNEVMRQLKPFFQSGKVKSKGTFVVGTVS